MSSKGVCCVAATRPAWRVLKDLSWSTSPSRRRCCSDSTRLEGTESLHIASRCSARPRCSDSTRLEGTERLHPTEGCSAHRRVAATRPAWRVLKVNKIISFANAIVVAATRPAWRVLKGVASACLSVTRVGLQRLDPLGGY